MVSIVILNEEIRMDHQKNWDLLINTRELVLHPEIDYFDPIHLGIAEQVIFPEHGGPKTHILALDSTSPSEWWTNDMLGYLALQARWMMQQTGRNVSRFFVWNTCQFQSTAGMKIIQLHRLFGFKTYIISQQCWDRIAKKYKAGKLNHECFVWDDDSAQPCKVDMLSPHTYGYKSFWTLKDGETERDRIIDKLKAEKKSVFFNPQDNNDTKQYREFLTKLENDPDVTNITTQHVDAIREEISKHVSKHNC
jgi:hypothetical protein